MRMTRILRIIADKTKRVGVNPQYPRHPRSINPSFATNANKLTPYTQFKTDLDVSVRPLSVQKTNRIPVSSLLPGIAAVGRPKRGDVRTPENPIGFT